MTEAALAEPPIAAPPAPPAAPPAPAAAAPAVPPATPAPPIASAPVEPAAPVAGKWPDDWRQQIAGEDKKALERLARYDSPSAVAKALSEAQEKISKGLKPASRPPETATDDEKKAWRAAAGIPETVEDYVKAIVLPDKREIGADDKPIIEAFAERALKSGVSPSDMAPLIDEYYAMQEEQANQQAEKDAEFKATNNQALREEWGGEYKANINAIRPYFESIDATMFDNLLGGRMADGTKVGDNAGIIKFFVAKALQENPAATVVPAGGNQVQAIQDEINTIKKEMGDPSSSYWKDPARQERYRKLIDAQTKLAPK